LARAGRSPGGAAPATRRIKSLQSPWKTPFLRDSAIQRQKIPIVYNGLRFDLANFSKFFLGRNGENQEVASEKIWNRVSGPSLPFAPRQGFLAPTTD
jgi:hypothetical protein